MFPADTIPELIGVKPGIVVIGMIVLIIGLLSLMAILRLGGNGDEETKGS